MTSWPNKVNSFVQFKVKDIYDDKILLSRKNVQKEALDWVKENLETGMIVNGIVKNIRKFGAFVEIGGGVVGLLHIEDISVSRIKSPEERFFIGQKINVMIKSIDKENNKIVQEGAQIDWICLILQLKCNCEVIYCFWNNNRGFT